MSLELFASPLSAELASSERILIAGAGGGFDVFCGLPLFFALRAAGKDVHLANLSFTHLAATGALRLSEVTWRVDQLSVSAASYFPECYLAQWLQREGHPSEVYAFDTVGVAPLSAAYAELCRELRIDTIILVDGGTDILMRGDEAGLGTPAEDMTSLAAAYAVPDAKKILSCLGFGIDAFHGVCHAHFLENVAALERRGGFLGAHSLQLADPHVRAFGDALEYVHQRMPTQESIVNGSILSALEGRSGDFHRSDRTRPSKLFINPLMALYWHFRLADVAEQSLYLQTIAETQTLLEVHLQIEAFRKTVAIRERTSIPV